MIVSCVVSADYYSIECVECCVCVCARLGWKYVKFGCLLDLGIREVAIRVLERMLRFFD